MKAEDTGSFHFLTSDDALLDSQGAFGTFSCYLRESEISPFPFTIFTGDSERRCVGKLLSQPIPPGPDARSKRLYQTGEWQILHCEAYQAPILPNNVLTEMFRDSSAVGKSADSLVNFIERHMPDRSCKRSHSERYRTLFSQIPAGSFIHFQTFTSEDLIQLYADDLRRRKCRLSYHHHEVIPPNLHNSGWGRELLSALSKMDQVYVYIDDYVDRLYHSMTAIGLRPPERIEPFSLGADVKRLSRGLALVDGSSTAQIPGYHNLPNELQRQMRECFSSKSTVPHRFVCFDRIDAIKGIVRLLEGIDLFLEKEKTRIGEEEIKKRYRFFFFQQLYHDPKAAVFFAESVQGVYIRAVEALHTKLGQKYPGIIFVAPAVEGEAALAVPALMRDAHILSGGAADGLNLAVQESAWVNLDYDTAVICGTGAGFARQTIRNGNGRFGLFPDPGSADSYCRAIEQVVATKEKSSGHLREQKRELVIREVQPRIGKSIFAGIESGPNT